MPRKTLALLATLLVGLTAGRADAAAWQDTHKAFRIGFLTTAGAAYDMRRLEPFRAYVQAAIGMPVELVPAVSYSALIDAEATDRIQYAIHTATSYVTTAARCQCVEPLAAPAAFDGARGFYAIILARAASDIRAPADAKGKVLAVTADDSIAGRLVPLKYLARDGIDANSDFGSVVEAADPAAAIGALQAGVVDLAVGWSSLTGNAATGYDFGVLTSLVRAGSLSMDGVRVIWQSPLIPFGPHVVRSDIPPDLRAKLLAALQGMAAASPVALDAVDRSSIGGGGFMPVAVADYAVIADLIGVAGPPAASAVNPRAPAVPPAAVGSAPPAVVADPVPPADPPAATPAPSTP